MVYSFLVNGGYVGWPLAFVSRSISPLRKKDFEEKGLSPKGRTQDMLGVSLGMEISSLRGPQTGKWTLEVNILDPWLPAHQLPVAQVFHGSTWEGAWCSKQAPEWSVRPAWRTQRNSHPLNTWNNNYFSYRWAVLDAYGKYKCAAEG